MRSLPAIVAVAAVALLSGFAMGAHTGASAASTLDRPADPVVLTGAEVPTLQGDAPGSLVAFRYDAGWVQIPVQVDERDTRTFDAIFNNLAGGPITALQYTDPNTFTGPDSDPNIDANDEIAFMAKDAGDAAPSFSEPAHVVAGSGQRVKIDDPLAPGDTGYVYLFRQDGSLDPAAGQAYVAYAFDLLSGDYKTTYKLNANGGNPEDSTVTTPAYTYHFGDRWQDDGMSITAGASSGVDILDRHKPIFLAGYCGRTEDTFDGVVASSPIEGAFVANKVGPVRAIRAYAGANSGPNTEREHVFYADRQEIRTYLRVHSIPSVGDFFDYSPAASGMTYYNDLNTGGVTIDGVPDSVTTGPILWELVTGAQGSVTMAGVSSTNIPGFAYTSYYEDKSAPATTTQCTGDANAYGTSGAFVNPSGGVPCTDARLGCTSFLSTTRFMYFDGPGLTPAGAQQHNAEANAPLVATVQPFVGAGDSDVDGVADASDNCPAVVNNGQTNNDRNFINQHPTYGVDDATLTRSDALGDVCDYDDDNDGLSDFLETSLAALQVTCPDASAATNPAALDSDGDRAADAAECEMGSDPANAASRPSTSFPGGTDSDNDKLSNLLEVQLGSDPGDSDTDGDGLPDGVEFKGYNASPIAPDSDGDGTRDSCEAASINADQVVNPGDQALLAAELMRGVPASQKLANMDINRDGALNPGDQALQASRVGPGKCP